jgi:hypothetical protein
VTTIDFKNNLILRKPANSRLYEYYYITFEAALIQFTGNRVVCDSLSTMVDLSILATSFANISHNYIEADYLDLSSLSATYSIVRNVFRDNYNLFQIRTASYSNVNVDARFNWWPKGTLPITALQSSSYATFLVRSISPTLYTAPD